ncbi:MAG TPA: HTTM domain-containing protein [Gemmataceae bacterium]|nr:HTTM domain-containing protein [Gemmataceae bacterium]
MTGEPRFVGIQPRFPGFLARWKWLTEPIAAERMAALRIAAALALLLDIFVGCLPSFSLLFTADGLAGREAYPWRFREGHHYWSVLRWLPDAWGPHALMGVWIVAAFALLIGYRPLVTGLVCWVCAVSFQNINPWACNGGDQLRNTLLVAVAVSRGGAVWGVQSVGGRVVVPGWPAKVLLVQLVCVYFFSGIYKAVSPAWQSGYMMYFVNRDLAWSLIPSFTGRMPVMLDRIASWGTVAWELAFPLLIVFRRTRAAALWVGFVFHALSFLTLEVGHFALYSTAWYALFLPWERWSRSAPCRG